MSQRETVILSGVSRPARDGVEGPAARPDSHSCSSLSSSAPRSTPRPPSSRPTRPAIAPAGAPATRLPPAPATHTFHDPTYHLSFDYPANWTFSRTDREISTFHLDARSAPASTNPRRRRDAGESLPRVHLLRGLRLLQCHAARLAASCAAAKAPRSSATFPTKPGARNLRRRHSLHPRPRRVTRHLRHPARRDLHHPPRRRLLPLRPRHQQLLRRRSLRRQRHHPRRTRPGPRPPESILNTIRFDPK